MGAPPEHFCEEHICKTSLYGQSSYLIMKLSFKKEQKEQHKVKDLAQLIPGIGYHYVSQQEQQVDHFRIEDASFFSIDESGYLTFILMHVANTKAQVHVLQNMSLSLYSYCRLK